MRRPVRRGGCERGSTLAVLVVVLAVCACLAGVGVGVASVAGGSGPAGAGTGGAGAGGHRLTVTVPSVWDWSQYGYDAGHTFDGRTTLTEKSVKRLKEAWFFPTGDAVTSTPTVVNGTVYFGSWDTRFYAVSLATGTLEWEYQLDQQHGVTPFPGEHPRDSSSDGGLVTSSALFVPGNGTTRPDLVVFGGGYSLYALDAETGKLFWRRIFNGNAPGAPMPSKDDTRIFSSPVLVDGTLVFATDVDGQSGEHGEIAGVSLETGKTRWVVATDATAASGGVVANDGCGSVWSSGSYLRAQNAVLFATADCNSTNTQAYAEELIAVDPADGTVLWQYKPKRPDPNCDLDFGASVNVGTLTADGKTFIGMGGKDGSYYSISAVNHRLVWSKRVVFGGSAGGFIGTTAFDGTDVYGATALGDDAAGTAGACAPGNPHDKFLQNPALHAFDAATGQVLWSVDKVQSFGPTTVAGGLLFNGPALMNQVQVRLASTGQLLVRLKTQVACWGGIATVGDAVVFGTGSDPQGSPDGVYAFTPGGKAPVVP